MKSNIDKELYAQLVAGYITGVCTANTISGNYHIIFEEINDTFGLNLPEDKEMLGSILDAMNGDIVSDVEAVNDFDVMLFTSFCPFYEED